MEVIIPSNNSEFNFNSPHVSLPSTPKRFGEYYCSAPTSPSHLSQFYRDFDDFSASAKSNGDDFAFDVNEEWETASLSAADELFDGGMIKPLQPPPPRLHLLAAARTSELEATPLRKMPSAAVSPRKKNRENNPLGVGDQNATRAVPPQRGRERDVNLSKTTSRRAARSLSPVRDAAQYPWEEETEQKNPTPSTVFSAAAKGQKKWRLKDFFLFRSASEGRAAEKDPLKKYTAAAFRQQRSSFRAVDSPGSGSGSKRRGPVSAHELHYTVNRAVSEDLKKKTFLPYKQGILGRLAFNPAVHALANSFGLSRK